MDFSGTTTNESAAMAAYQAERVNADPVVSTAPVARCSKRLLEELLALNEEMITQLHLERVSDAGTAGFLTEMIAQHEKAAALLRAQLAAAGSGARR
jgi:DNA-binding ferritin-like protein